MLFNKHATSMLWVSAIRLTAAPCSEKEDSVVKATDKKTTEIYATNMNNSDYIHIELYN